MRSIRLPATLLLSACSSSPATAPASTGADPDPVVEPLPAPADLVVHEWGTFTSVQSSIGETLDGLNHTDEAVPAFVVARRIGAGGKGAEQLPEPVNQKLETPVIYFHTRGALHVSVNVSFPTGVVSQWYPNAASYAPPLYSMTKVGDGQMSWEADLNPAGLAPPSVEPTSIWAPSRRVAAAGVRVRTGTGDAQDEQFIFYRGLARFTMPFSVAASRSGSDTLRITNSSGEDIPAAFLLVSQAEGGAIVPLGALRAHGSIETVASPRLGATETYVQDAQEQLAAVLAATGLYADEARAMVDTWTRSYFRTTGVRVLYVVPRAWTDGLLPMTITPRPVELVRTLVGRVEVLTSADEKDVVARLQAANAAGQILAGDALGRFTEPKLRRALQMITDPDLAAYAQMQLVYASYAP